MENNQFSFLSNDEGLCYALGTITGNNEDVWQKVKVLIDCEWTDDVTEVRHYEYRYRCYVTDVMKILFGEKYLTSRYEGYYWEKDLNGNPLEGHLPNHPI